MGSLVAVFCHFATILYSQQGLRNDYSDGYPQSVDVFQVQWIVKPLFLNVEFDEQWLKIVEATNNLIRKCVYSN